MAPDGWTHVELASVASITMGQAPPSSDVAESGDGLPFIQGNAEFGFRHPSPQKVCRVPLKIAEIGDVLISVRAPVGALNLADRQLAIGRGLAAIRLRGIDSGFGWHAIASAAVQLRRLAQGSTFEAVNRDALAAMVLPRPPLAEQRKITAILSSVDETIEKTEAVLAQLDVVKKAMLEELLTRGIAGRHSRFKQTEIGEVPETWSVVALDECNDPARPICYGILMPGKQCAGGVPVIKVKNIKSGEVETSDLLLTSPEIDAQYRRSRLRGGDLLLTIRGTTGRVALVPASLDGANITQDTARVSAGESTTSAFLYYALQTANAQAQISDHTRGQAVKGINIGDVRRLLLPLPPKGEQQTIVETVRAIDENFRAESLALSALRATKNALAAVLLAGELRVTAEDAA